MLDQSGQRPDRDQPRRVQFESKQQYRRDDRQRQGQPVHQRYSTEPTLRKNRNIGHRPNGNVAALAAPAATPALSAVLVETGGPKPAAMPVGPNRAGFAVTGRIAAISRPATNSRRSSFTPKKLK